MRLLARFLAKDQELIRRWRTAASACTFIGALFWVLAIFAFAQESGGSWIFAAIAGVGGLCLGLALWFTSFVAQWPVIRPFIDAEKLRQRIIELDNQSPK